VVLQRLVKAEGQLVQLLVKLNVGPESHWAEVEPVLASHPACGLITSDRRAELFDERVREVRGREREGGREGRGGEGLLGLDSKGGVVLHAVGGRLLHQPGLMRRRWWVGNQRLVTLVSDLSVCIPRMMIILFAVCQMNSSSCGELHDKGP
jgi:hypothetical protein